MSRLEQMRQHFLQRVHNEQQQLSLQLPLRRGSAMSCTKSIQNIPGLLQFPQVQQSQLRRTPSNLEPSHGRKYGQGQGFYSSESHIGAKANLSRVKSLNSINLVAPSRMKPKCANSKQSESTKRNLTPSGNEAQTNNAKVNRPPTRTANNSRTLAVESKRFPANNGSTRNELQCKHCDRKFAAKERLDKHVEICAKTLHKKRPIFNSSKQRFFEQSNSPQADPNCNGESGKVSTIVYIQFYLKIYKSQHDVTNL